jgi:hypothetical protein
VEERRVIDRTNAEATAANEPFSFEEALDRQLAEMTSCFAHGVLSHGGSGPRTLTVEQYEAALPISRHGGWTWLDHELIRAVREGAKPGDPLPPIEAEPFIRHALDTEVGIVGEAAGRRVAVLFSHEDFPGVRFGHRFRPMWSDDPDKVGTGWEEISLLEFVEAGGLHRMMENPPAADAAGITWTDWSD